MEAPSIDRNSDQTLSSATTIALREAIIAGKIAAGEKLNEPKLAHQFNVSRGPLREAIRRLVAMGLVHHVPHRGARVVTLELKSVMELYEVREALESTAAGLAAKNMNKDEITNLRELLEVHRRHVDCNEGKYLQVEGDFDFHYRIIRGCGNTMLINQLCDELYHLIRMFRHQASRFKTRSNRALIEHAQLLDAIELRDSDMAEMVMKYHIRRAKNSIYQTMTKNEGSPND